MGAQLLGTIEGRPMKAILKLREGEFEELMAHLLPPRAQQEQAAFLFVSTRQDASITFETQAKELLTSADFEAQESDYLELRDETRARLIKRAHDLNASLVEMHSHPGPYPAAFSASDRIGLAETVPHMWWRLKKRPYLAIVMARTGFDALLWLDNAQIPRALDAVLAGTRLLKPTNLSLADWQ
jgi:Prokaryotic homologs of the JAB domain